MVDHCRDSDSKSKTMLLIKMIKIQKTFTAPTHSETMKCTENCDQILAMFGTPWIMADLGPPRYLSIFFTKNVASQRRFTTSFHKSFTGLLAETWNSYDSACLLPRLDRAKVMRVKLRNFCLDGRGKLFFSNTFHPLTFSSAEWENLGKLLRTFLQPFASASPKS